MPTALIVNDDPIQLRVAAEILARDGFEALSCRGAEEALNRLGERGNVDLIVTDLYMPGIDGWRLCRLLRSTAYAAFNNIPILVASATFSGSEADEVTAQVFYRRPTSRRSYAAWRVTWLATPSRSG